MLFGSKKVFETAKIFPLHNLMKETLAYGRNIMKINIFLYINVTLKLEYHSYVMQKKYNMVMILKSHGYDIERVSPLFFFFLCDIKIYLFARTIKP